MESKNLPELQSQNKLHLKYLIKNVNLIQLPSSLWGCHVDSNKFVAFSKLDVINNSRNTTKSVVFRDTKNSSHLKIDIFMNNLLVEVPFISKDIKTIQELNYLLTAVNDVQFCKCYLENKNNCLLYCPPFLDVCNWCSKNIKDNLAHDDENKSQKYICSMCGIASGSAEELITHEGNHLPKNNGHFECTICTQTFDNAKEILKHYELYHITVKFIECLTCNKKYTKGNMLKTHMRSHKEFEKYKCSTCRKRYPNQHELKVHSCLPLKSYHICPTCKKKYRTSKLLQQHEKEHRRERERKNYLGCKKCSRFFNSPEEVALHKTICYTRQFKYKCNVCGQKFGCISQKMCHVAKYGS